MNALADLTAYEALGLLRRRETSAEELVRALLERIAAAEPLVEAWELVDAEGALAQARRIDAMSLPPPLAGLPIGVKDIIDTAGLPTERGTPICRGRIPDRDASAVARLRAAGAVILGKTVTTEFAFYRPGKTRNPHDPTRTPGGSSSGSAAAVAARMVPAALGSQTAGSLIRPASFCGVVGMKPTHGLVPTDGVSPLAPSLDTLGVLVRDARDLPPLLAAMGIAGPEPLPLPTAPRLGLCRTAQWPLADPETRSLLEEVAAQLALAGAHVREVELDRELDGLFDAQKAVMAVEAARSFAELRRSRESELSAVLLDLVRAGEATEPARYAAALELGALGRARLPRILAGMDALLTPAAIGEAPCGLASTGDPAFNRVWTLLGAPCIGVPAGSGPHGLPIGVQLVGLRGGDLPLAILAAWTEAALLAGRVGGRPPALA